MSRISLGSRLAIIIVCCCLATIMAVVAAAYQALNQDFETLLTDHQLDETRRISEKVSQNLQARLMMLDAFSATLTDGNQLLRPGQINDLIARQDVLAEMFPNALLVLDENATAIAENQYVPNRIGTNYADRSHFAEALNTREPLISKPIIGRRTGVPLLSFVTLIESDDDDLLGFISGSIDLNQTSLIPKDAQTLSNHKQAEFLVIDAGNFLYVEKPNDQGGISPLPPPGEDPIIDAALSGTSVGTVANSAGTPMIYATSHLERLGWMFIHAVPKELARAPAVQSFFRFFLLSLLVIAIIAPLSYVITRSAMLPLDRMTRRIKNMSATSSSADRLDERGPPEVANLANAFNKLLDERDTISQMKEDFVSNVSHELRTPLTSINGALRLINSGATGELPEKTVKMSQLALRNGERLQRLISDLLDFNKLAAGELVIVQETQLLEPIVSVAVSGNQAMAMENNVELTGACAPDLPIYTDAHRVQQILDNFISNAIKFSPAQGQVNVVATTCEDSFVRMTVSDQGKGFPEHFRARLFERFSQAEIGTKRAHKGTGLGLAICRELTALLGGRIGAYNAQGAHFWVELPLGHPPTQEPQTP